MHAGFSFSYLRFAEAASFDKKELRRSCTTYAVQNAFKILTYAVQNALKILTYAVQNALKILTYAVSKICNIN